MGKQIPVTGRIPMSIQPKMSLGVRKRKASSLIDSIVGTATKETRGSHFVVDDFVVVDGRLRPSSEYPVTVSVDVTVSGDYMIQTPRTTNLEKVQLDATHRWSAAHGYTDGVWAPVHSSLLPSREFKLVAANADGVEIPSSAPRAFAEDEFRYFDPVEGEYVTTAALQFTADDMLRTQTGGWQTNSGMGVIAALLPEQTDPYTYTHILGFIPPTRREGDLFGLSLVLRGSNEYALLLDEPGPGPVKTLDVWRHQSGFTTPWVMGLQFNAQAQTVETFVATESVVRQHVTSVPRSNVPPLSSYMFSLDLALFASDAEEGMELFDVCMWHTPPPRQEWENAKHAYMSAFGAGRAAV